MRSRRVPLVKEEHKELDEEFDRFLENVKEAGTILRDLRKENGWSLSDLAQEVAVDKSHLAAFERGQQPIPEGLAKRFAEIFDVPERLFLVGA